LAAIVLRRSRVWRSRLVEERGMTDLRTDLTETPDGGEPMTGPTGTDDLHTPMTNLTTEEAPVSERMRQAGVHRDDTGIEVFGIPAAVRLWWTRPAPSRGIVALVFSCRPRSGPVDSTAEATRVRWLTVDEVTEHMDQAYSVRVTDALADVPVVRAHDGAKLIKT